MSVDNLLRAASSNATVADVHNATASSAAAPSATWPSAANGTEGGGDALVDFDGATSWLRSAWLPVGLMLLSAAALLVWQAMGKYHRHGVWRYTRSGAGGWRSWLPGAGSGSRLPRLWLVDDSAAPGRPDADYWDARLMGADDMDDMVYRPTATAHPANGTADTQSNLADVDASLRLELHNGART